MKIPGLFRPEKNVDVVTNRLLKDEPSLVKRVYGNLEIVHAGTYAQGIAGLQKRGREPFTFAENVEARIADYEANGENSELFETPLYSVAGVVHKRDSVKFKLILKSDKLENIAKGFNQRFIPIDYDAEKGIELDSSKGKYNELLTRKEAKNHKFWIAVMNGNKEMLARYVDLWFDKTGKEIGMGVFLKSNTDSDELWTIVLCNDLYTSDAAGSDLCFGTCFVLCNQ